MSKYLGIDFGEKCIGLALSDDSLQFAFPFKVLENTENIVNDIVKICDENKVELIVMGESKNFEMEDNEIMKEVNLFTKKFQKISSIPIKFHPEFMTSQEAERLQGKNDMLDASAASIILKSYLEKNNGEQ